VVIVAQTVVDGSHRLLQMGVGVNDWTDRNRASCASPGCAL
jgi:hypothetical protein